MVVVLWVFAFALLGGGIAAVAEGYPIVINERGWALVIAGATVASAGAVLLGLAVVAARLGRVRTEVARLADRVAPRDAGTPLPPAGTPTGTPADGGAGALLGAGALGGVAAVAAPSAGPLASARSLVDQDRRALGKRTGTEEPSVPVADDDLVRSPRDGPRDLDSAPDLLPGPDASARKPGSAGALRPRTDAGGGADAAAPEADGDPGETSPDAVPARAVVGKYESGGNAYTMYDDGSIEAETPTGSYRFASLDELKEFIAAGGESEAATP